MFEQFWNALNIHKNLVTKNATTVKRLALVTVSAVGATFLLTCVRKQLRQRAVAAKREKKRQESQASIEVVRRKIARSKVNRTTAMRL